MEYLVNMTTHVPDGTPDQAVDDIRAREAAHSRELAAAGHLLRLWRPPLQPGEWRSLGLFAAADGGQLEEVLASMPLRVWRTDEVTPLAPHANDPALAPSNAGTEFLTTFTINVPEGMPGYAVDDTEAREAQRTKGAGRAGAPAAAVEVARPVARAGPVERREPRRDAGDLEVAAPGPVDDRRDHAAQPPPERPGDDHPMTGTTGESPSSPEARRASAPAGGPVPRARLGGGGQRPHDQAVRGPGRAHRRGRHREARHRRPDHRGSTGAVRPHRHPGQ